MRISKIVRLGLLVVALFSIGCMPRYKTHSFKTYQGPPVAVDQVAFLITQHPIRVMRVDEQLVMNIEAHLRIGMTADLVEINPGLRQVELAYLERSYNALTSASAWHIMTFEAGGIYKVDYKIIGKYFFNKIKKVGSTVMTSPDGKKRISLVRRKNTKQDQAGDQAYFSVKEGAQEKLYAAFETSILPTFSKNGKRIAFVAENPVSKKYMVVVDGEPSPSRDNVTGLEFGPKGEKFLYRFQRQDQWFLSVNGQELGPFIEPPKALFSPGAQRLAYWGKQGEMINLYLDGRKIANYNNNISIIFSPNSHQWAYIGVNKKDKDCWGKCIYSELFKDGKKLAASEVISAPLFSPDSKKLSYIKKDGNRFVVVLDEEKSNHYDLVTPPHFSRDNTLWFFAKKGRRWTLVKDSKEGDEFWAVAKWKSSPDERRFAYAGLVSKDNWVVIVDDKRDPQNYNKILSYKIQFSPDSRHYVYVAQKGEEQFLVVDGKEKLHAHLIYQNALFFHPDGKRLATIAVKQKGGQPEMIKIGL